MLELNFSNQTKDKRFGGKFFESVLEFAVKKLGLNNKRLQVSVNLVDGPEIKSLNVEHRSKNAITDVLSFPLHKKLPDSVIIDLGDIFICPSFVGSISDKSKKNVTETLKEATVHGFLHLLGYNHEKNVSESKKMLSLQKNILEETPDNL